jgi:hypothetical protein
MTLAATPDVSRILATGGKCVKGQRTRFFLPIITMPVFDEAVA